MNKNLIKLAILSVSLLTIMAGAAISPALGNIALAFPEVSETKIKLILTLPSAFIIPFIYVSSYLTRKYPKKHILLVGMVLYLIGGIGGGYVNSVDMILVFRAILGVGVGLIMPISTSLVADFFEGEERTATMGQVTAANNLGGVILFIMSGFLAGMSWRVSFNVYAIALVCAVIVYFLLPKRKPDVMPKGSERVPLPKIVYGIGLAMFFVVLAFYSIPANISLYMQQAGIGDSQQAGIVIAVGTAAGFVAGLMLTRLNGWLQSYNVPIQLFFMAAGFLIISMAENTVMLGIGVGVMGFGFGSLMPIIFDLVPRIVARNQVVSAMAVCTSMLFIGQFLSPIVLDAVGMLFNNMSIQFTYQFLGISMFVATGLFFLRAVRLKQTKRAVNG